MPRLELRGSSSSVGALLSEAAMGTGGPVSTVHAADPRLMARSRQIDVRGMVGAMRAPLATRRRPMTRQGERAGAAWTCAVLDLACMEPYRYVWGTTPRLHRWPTRPKTHRA